MKKFFLAIICMLIVAPFSLVLTGCGAAEVYSIYVKSSDVEYGSVAGQGNYSDGTQITVRATPMKEANFLCWTLNNKVVSSEPEYTFTVNKENNGTFVALFDQRLDYYALTEVAVSFNDGVQIQEFTTNIQVGSSLSSLQTLYNVSTNPVIMTQNFASTAGFYSGQLLHKKTTDNSYYCRLSASGKYEEDIKSFQENFTINFDKLYEDGIFVTEEKTMTGYGTIRLTFEKVNKTIVNNILGITATEE